MNYKDTALSFADECKITTTTTSDDSNKNYDTLAASLDSIDNKSRTDYHHHHPQMSPHTNKKGTAPTGGLPHVKVPIDAPGGFLYEWWVVFWDMFTAKHNRTTNKDAMAYVEAQQVRAFSLSILYPLFRGQNFDCVYKPHVLFIIR